MWYDWKAGNGWYSGVNNCRGDNICKCKSLPPLIFIGVWHITWGGIRTWVHWWISAGIGNSLIVRQDGTMAFWVLCGWSITEGRLASVQQYQFLILNGCEIHMYIDSWILHFPSELHIVFLFIPHLHQQLDVGWRGSGLVPPNLRKVIKKLPTCRDPRKVIKVYIPTTSSPYTSKFYWHATQS